MSSPTISRRHFFLGTLLAGAIPAGGFGSVPSLRQIGFWSPNEKLNVAAIGAGGRAETNIIGVDSENVVALVDPDSDRAATRRARTSLLPARSRSGSCSARSRFGSKDVSIGIRPTGE